MVNIFRPHFCAGLGIAAALILAGEPASAAPAELLQPWTELTGARPGSLSDGAAVRGDYIMLRYPAAVSARGNDVYLVDAGLRRIFRYDRAQQTLARFTTLTPDAGTAIYAAPDMTVYVINPTGSQVLHFAHDGAPLPSLGSAGDIVRPVSVAVDEGGGRVLVADGSYDQIVVFSSLGRPLSVIKPQQVRAVSAIASGRDGAIYVVDRLARQVVVLEWDGTFRHAFGAGELTEPGAIAVNRDGLVFVGDNFDRTIKAYRDGFLVARTGGTGNAPDRFGGIGGLAVDDGGLLYVTDGQNARVKIMLLTPDARQGGYGRMGGGNE